MNAKTHNAQGGPSLPSMTKTQTQSRPIQEEIVERLLHDVLVLREECLLSSGAGVTLGRTVVVWGSSWSRGAILALLPYAETQPLELIGNREGEI